MAIRFTESAIAQRYALFRPHYPDSLRSGLLQYICKRSSVPVEKQTVLDIGCGSGQSTFFAAKAGFGRVRGLDTSSAQIEEAKKVLQKQGTSGCSNIDFCIADADQSLSMPSHSVDVVILGQALHWFDFPKFYHQVDRTLNPGGIFLAFGYGNCQVLTPAVQKLVSDFYHNQMGSYWSKERRYIDNHYKTIPMPYQPVERLTDELRYSLTLSDLVGYIGSWSAYATYCAEHPGTTIMDELQEKFVEAVKASPELMERFHASGNGHSESSATKDIGQVELEIKFPIFALMCQKPD